MSDEQMWRIAASTFFTLLIVYSLPNIKETVAYWREKWDALSEQVRQHWR